MTTLKHLWPLCCFAVGLLTLTSCGVGAVGCDFRNTTTLNGPEPRCQERTGLESISFAQSCDALGGASVDGGCEREGIVGGCKVDGSDAIIDWYYEKTVDEVKAECRSDPFVEAPGA